MYMYIKYMVCQMLGIGFYIHLNVLGFYIHLNVYVYNIIYTERHIHVYLYIHIYIEREREINR